MRTEIMGTARTETAIDSEPSAILVWDNLGNNII